MIHVFGIVEDSLAGITCNDLIVLADFLKDLRTNTHLADFAYFVAGGSNTNSATVFSNAVILGDKVRRNRTLDLLPFFQVGLQRTHIALVLIFQRFPLLVDLRLIFFHADFGGLDIALI